MIKPSGRSLQIPFPVSVLANHIYLNMDNESSRDHYYQLAHSILESRVRSRKPISLTFYQDALQDVEYLHQLTGRGAHLEKLLGKINEAGGSTDSTFSLCPYEKNQKIDLPGGQINDLSFFEGAILF